MLEQLEDQMQTDTEVTNMADEIGGILQAAFDLLIERLARQYADASEPLDAERESLTQESATIEEARVSLERLLPAQARVAQREADRLTLAGKHEEATAKIAEAEEARTAPEAMKERQREINLRLTAIDREKTAVAKRVFEQWYPDVQAVCHAAETAFFLTLLNGLEKSFYEYQERTGSEENRILTLNRILGLTADERSAEFRIGQNFYRGRA